MLIDVISGKRITKMPFAREFDAMKAKLSHEEFDRVIARINELVDEGSKEVATAGWLPGSDWTGTPFEPIFTKAARRNYDLSARFFGLAVWYTVMHRDERWASGRYQLPGGRDIGSRTYFRID